MNYLIKYHVTSSIGALLKSGQVRVKNAMSQKDALYEFNKMIRSKFTIPVNVQIESMETEQPSQLHDIFDIFGDIFKQ